MESGKIRITENIDSSLAEQLNQFGFECDQQTGISYDKVLASVHQYEGIIVATRISIDKKFIDAATERIRF